MPTTTPEHDERIAKMTLSSVYPHCVTKVEKKGRTTEDLQRKLIDDKVTFEEFFQHATLKPERTSDHGRHLRLPG